MLAPKTLQEGGGRGGGKGRCPDRVLPRRGHERDRRQVVGLVGPELANRRDDRLAVSQIQLEEGDPVADAIQRLVAFGRPEYRPVDVITVPEQQLGEVRPILPADPGHGARRDIGRTLDES